MRDRPGGTVRAAVHVLDSGRRTVRRDDLVTEEPLEIRVAAGGVTRTMTVTMRTPGADFELAVGFLYAEGAVGAGAVRTVAYCLDLPAAEQRYNVVTVDIDAPTPPEPLRSAPVSSACGVCGTASLEALRARQIAPVGPAGRPRVDVETLYRLPAALRDAQRLFARTGGLHAAGLFTVDGGLAAAREDIGRHNAVDKLVGWALLGGRLPLTESVLVVSGRAGYEIVQKAAVAGIPVVCAVSAPSSLAVAAAEEFGLTLVGFLRGRRCNVYAGADRVALPTGADPRPSPADLPAASDSPVAPPASASPVAPAASESPVAPTASDLPAAPTGTR